MKRFIILMTVMLLFTSCSHLWKKERIVISSEQVSNAIMIDDNYLLNKYLSDGFPIDFENNGETLLKLALENNSLKSLSTLLDRGADIDARDNKTGMTPIFYSRSIEALKLLLKDGADINVYDYEGNSLFSYFIKNKPISYSYLLMNYHPNYQEWNTLFQAAISGNDELIRKMAKSGANFAQKDKDGNYPIYYSYDEKNILALLDVASYDLKAKNKKGEIILGEVYLRSVANNFPQVVNRLIELGVDPNYMSYGDNAISIAKNNNNAEMIEFLYEKGIK